MFNKNELKDLEKETTPKLPVQELWFELAPYDVFEWSPLPAAQCQGVQGGGGFGPSSATKQAAGTAKELSGLFF